MYNPKYVLTNDGYKKYIHHIYNMRQAVNYIREHYDDLHIGANRTQRSKTIEDFIYSFEELEEMLISGDGEKYEQTN